MYPIFNKLECKGPMGPNSSLTLHPHYTACQCAKNLSLLQVNSTHQYGSYCELQVSLSLKLKLVNLQPKLYGMDFDSIDINIWRRGHGKLIYAFGCKL